MAPMIAVLFLALVGAVPCLHFAVADEVTGVEVGGYSGSVVAARDAESGVDVGGIERAQVDDEIDASGVVEEGDDGVHSMARILAERSSHRCWSENHCKKFFKKPGCCKEKCVNLESDSRNCGTCGRSCNTKMGYCCKSGTCRKAAWKRQGKSKKPHQSKSKKTPQSKSQKPHQRQAQTPHRSNSHRSNQHHSKPNKPSHSQKPSKHDEEKKPHKGGKNPYQPQHGSLGPCGYSKKCSRGFTCCRGKCVNLKSNSGHCGRCDKGCGYGRACAGGQCLDLKHDNRNCGKSGRSCGYGRKCCNGCCKNIFGNDMQNCGSCGKKCATTCSYGMCGYGH